MNREELFEFVDKLSQDLMNNGDISIKDAYKLDVALGGVDLVMMDFDELETFIFGVYQGIKTYKESEND